MKRITLLILYFTFYLFAKSDQAETATVIPNIPHGFIVVSESSGDFTGDGINDVAQVIEKVINDYEEIRRLRVYTGNSDGSYTLIIDNDSIIVESVMGRADPFMGIEIRKNSIFISNYWYAGESTVTQYIYRDEQFKIAGEENAEDEFVTRSVNYLTNRVLTREIINDQIVETWSDLDNPQKSTL